MRDHQSEFVELYQASYVDIVRFAARRIPRAHAEDLAAEAFTVAWRRLADLPSGIDEARAWVFGIARRLILAHLRQSGPILVEIPETLSTPGHEEAVVARADLATAWNRLSSRHQEVIALQVWDGLTSTQAAQVLNISPVAYRIRLSRARRSLSALLRSHDASGRLQITRIPAEEAHQS